MDSDANLIAFSSRTQMAERLADLIAANVTAAIGARGAARLAISGGSTPTGLYRTLARREIDWRRATAMLADERWTPPGTPGSNETLARDTLCQNHGRALTLTGLWSEADNPEAATEIAAQRLSTIGDRFDVAVLGMGGDGHTASWFPHMDALPAALSREAGVIYARAAKSEATGEHLDRLTLTLGAIADARLIILLITGENKRAVYRSAMEDGPVSDMPVRAILRARPDLWACWAP